MLWAAVAVMCFPLGVIGVDRWGAMVLGLLAANVIGSAIARREDRVAWVPVSVVVLNVLAGIAVVLLAAVRAGMLDLAAVGVAITAYSGFTILRVSPREAALSCLTYTALDAGLVLDACLARSISPSALALHWLALAATFGTGLMASRVLDRTSRDAFVQERVIEGQRATIARQQELLERELSHQVAERSRELGAVLARSDVTLDARRLAPGERFAERYRIVSALGAGGMGAVYEVERVTDGERLALKAVVGEVSGASAARFAREAEIGARLRHPSLVSILDVGVSAGVPFLAMELVRGGSLEAQRARFGDVGWALPILRQIAEGLVALHEAGVVHRDLKPANVLLSAAGAKISDFGISRLGALDDSTHPDPHAPTMSASPRPRSSELTGTGVVLGTPLYMAPEGARSARALDASADVFALGILAHEILTGRAPFAVPPFVLALAQQEIPAPPPIPGVAAPLAAVLVAALSADPADRPKARAILEALRSAEGQRAAGLW